MPFTASDFASWVFNREVGHPRFAPPHSGENFEFGGERERLRLGVVSHYEIEEMRRNHFPFGWNMEDKKLWSVDYHDRGEDGEILVSSTLLRKKDGYKLRGKPDLVFKNNKDHQIVIIERKTALKSATQLRCGSSDASDWPNCQAQLWAYAHLDRYVQAPRISLVLQPWHRDTHGNPQMGETTPPRIFEKQNDFDKMNLRRFQAYGGIRITDTVHATTLKAPN